MAPAFPKTTQWQQQQQQFPLCAREPLDAA
jgi:hypothetical protein